MTLRQEAFLLSFQLLPPMQKIGFSVFWLLEGYYRKDRRCQKRHRNFSDEAQSFRFKTPPRPLRLPRPLKEGKVLTVT